MAYWKPDSPKVGQVWEDWDSRGRTSFTLTRRVKIMRQAGPDHFLVQNVTTGRRTRIHRKRFRPNSTGYRLVQTT
jgi:hypothetical protein